MVIVSPLNRVAPLANDPNGLFMAYKWGLHGITTY